MSRPEPSSGFMRIDSFQLVDRVVALDLDVPSLSASARVPDDHAIFSGHFPGRPLMPGVLLTELMAQTCGFLLLSLNGFARMPFLAALKEVGFRSFVVPGTELVCEARREHDGSGYAVMQAKVMRRGEAKPVTDGTLVFRLMAYPDPVLRDHMRERADEVGLALDGSSVRLATRPS